MLVEEIRALEERLLAPAIRASERELDRMMSDDFVEFGSSGRVYTKAGIIRALLANPSPPAAASMEDFRVMALAPDVVLATYRYGGTLRSSVWRREAGDWRIVFHQGTPGIDECG